MSKNKPPEPPTDQGMIPSIFISYRRSDSGGHAGRLFDRLKDWFPKYALFYDCSNIDMGANFPEEIERAIRAAKVVLVIIGPDWLDTLNEQVHHTRVDFVRKEVTIALERRADNEIEIFPILVGDVGMPEVGQLHDDLKDEMGKLFDYQCLKFHMDVTIWNGQFERLLKRLADINGVPKQCAQLQQTDGAPTFNFQCTTSTHSSTSLNVPAVKQALDGVSKGLLNWPQETNGYWIERPELNQLYQLITQPDSTVTVLLGKPGEGKSAILARLGTKLSSEEVVLLAIKADQLPRHMATLSDLDKWIGCGIQTVEALQKLTKHRRVVVLIDQLDALADLMVQHTERLSMLIQFVNTVQSIQNLHVLMSCREFEFRNDVRFNALNAKKISLTCLSWEQVEPLLAKHGFDTRGWSEDVRSVLCTPQHLVMFIDHVIDKKNEPLFPNYQGLLTRIVRERLETVTVYGTRTIRTIEAAERIATCMALEEELWIGRAQFETEFGAELRHLEQTGFLVSSDNGLSIAFRHQTLFDFLRTRAFLKDGQSLALYIVKEKQESLFTRPILWSALNYLRASDRGVYREEFGDLWKQSTLRLHIQYLLVNFLGQLADPDCQEAQWLFSRFDEPTLHSRILHAVAGSQGWFAQLEKRLPMLMVEEPENTQKVAFILAKAVSFDPDRVLQAVREHWIGDEKYSPYVFTVMREFTLWNDTSIDTVLRLADHTPDDSFSIQEIANRISESDPGLAPKIIVRYLQALTRKIDAENTVTPCSPGSNVFITQQYRQLIDDDSGWHGIDKISMKAPRDFVKEIWPWLVDLFDRLSKEEHPFLQQYRNHAGLAFKRETDDRQPLQNAIKVAICCFAETEPKSFLDFVDKNKNTDLYVLHRLLVLGLVRIAQRHPIPALKYLLDDPRRFAIGDMSDDLRDSRALISATVPSLKSDEALCLEKAIMTWPRYRKVPKDESIKYWLKQRNWMREDRLRLLRAFFPFDRLSPQGQQHLGEEERPFPHTSAEIRHHIEANLVGSSMSAEQMEKATDDQIFALFEELPDSTEWNHPKQYRQINSSGGSIQASREFARFAKNKPDRALNLIRKFSAEKMERPAGAALAELAQDFTSKEPLVACVHELNERGFASEFFRADVAKCLELLANRFDGLDDATCDLLKGWITDWSSEGSFAETTDRKPSYLGIQSGDSKSEEEYRESLLWDASDIRILPKGNYPILRALMRGYLCRSSQAVNDWLAVLQQHLTRVENPAVWREIAVDLRHLVKADQEHAIKFLETVFSKYPRTLQTAMGVQLIWHIMRWIPDQFLENIIDEWLAGSWKDGPQAAGEIIAAKLCLNPNSTITQCRIEQILAGKDHAPSTIDGLRLGVTHTLIIAWAEPALRALTTPLLIQLSSIENTAVENALSKVFLKVYPLPPDGHTRKLLETLLDWPSILYRDSGFLIRGLKGLLHDSWEPRVVYRVIKALITKNKTTLSDGSTRLAASAGDLADIALTLHRIQDTREYGLELFEHLMNVNSHELEERLKTIDRPAFQ